MRIRKRSTKRITYVKSCQICGERKAIDRHHIIPRSEGGSDLATNIAILCPNCHRKCHLGYIYINEKEPWLNLGYKVKLNYVINT